MGSDWSQQVADAVGQVVVAFASVCVDAAIASVQWIVAGLGKSSEPNLDVIVPIYDRTLAIALLILGTILAIALIDAVVSGTFANGLGLIVRVIAASFAAYSGLALVKYVAGYAALLATTWTPDFSQLDGLLVHSVAVTNTVADHAVGGPHVSTFGLIFTAISVSCLAVMVHVELVVRSALILTVVAFVPLVCVIAIWPRAAGAATTLSEFLLGLFLSKFVVATIVYVGFRLVVVALTSTADTNTAENWMASGLAVLLIAAFSPLVVFSALRFTHHQAGSVARSFAGATFAAVPAGKTLAAVGRAAVPVVRSAQNRISLGVSRLRSRQ